MAPILAGKWKVDMNRYLPELLPLTFQLYFPATYAPLAALSRAKTGARIDAP
jgi:hypothetical protein